MRALTRLSITFLTLTGLLILPARADTIATFADPAADGSTPLFTRSGDILSGGWDGLGLDLITSISGETYLDATFTMSDLGIIDPSGSPSGGTIEFFESAAAGGGLILRVEFSGGLLFEPFGFGASDLNGQDVTFSGPIITIPPEEESFSFSFANQTTTPDGITWTAAFTSSAIPEPATMTLLIVGGLALGTARRGA